MLDWMWPRICLGCDRPATAWLCAGCVPGRPTVADDAPEGVRRVVSLAPYDGPVGRLVRRGKYTPDRWVIDRTAALLADRAGPVLVGFGAATVVPAPSAWQSRLKRGFATGAILARHLSRATGLPLRDVLTLRSGKRQATQNREERLANLRGRLRCDVDVSGPVWIVDDVLTTGATAAAAARELLASGASEVSVVVVCRVATDAQVSGDPIRATAVQNP